MGLKIGNIEILFVDGNKDCGINFGKVPESQVLLLLVDAGFNDVKARAQESARRNAQFGSYLAVIKRVEPSEMPRMFLVLEAV